VCVYFSGSNGREFKIQCSCLWSEWFIHRVSMCVWVLCGAFHTIYSVDVDMWDYVSYILYIYENKSPVCEDKTGMQKKKESTLWELKCLPQTSNLSSLNRFLFYKPMNTHPWKGERAFCILKILPKMNMEVTTHTHKPESTRPGKFILSFNTLGESRKLKASFAVDKKKVVCFLHTLNTDKVRVCVEVQNTIETVKESILESIEEHFK